ncbi:LytTR family transcriptional regulator [Lentzea sp. NBRC 105346]|uniref:LCP family protein n=1 Tax=Lentzea sp. NBRC 105346 TaxID=3032205 RepID=UPI0024A54F49|nr:LCP family protein [Lentzea sp. NBRC 105346]GLZ31039.1 LytTR family transcriptional regulator [Lentzea sp. NBRC 105346]
MTDLIREAIAAEADERVDPRTVMAELQKKRRRKPFGLIAGAGLTAAAVAVAVTVLVPRTEPSINVATAPPAQPQTVLLMGLDDYFHTDAIVLVHVDANGALGSVSIPRDSVVDIPGFRRERINEAYTEAYLDPKGEDPDVAGAKSLVKTVEQLTGTKIDHWASVKMSAFGKVADVLGGVDVCLKAAAKDTFSGADFPAGRVRLAGDQALAFLRQRHGLENGDLDRVARQQAFLGSVVAKLAQQPDKLGDIVKAINPSVKVDDGWDVLAFAKQIKQQVASGVIPVGVGDPMTPGLAVDPAAVREYVKTPPTKDPDTCVR